MEVDNETAIQCFKIPCNILKNLKITCDITNYRVVLWSKYQLFVYENLNFNKYSKEILPQFVIQELIVIKDCLMCLDCTGNVNVNTIETFSIWKQNIICLCACEIIEKQRVFVVSLQFEQNCAKLLVNEFDIQNDSPNELVGFEVTMPHEDWITPGDSNIMLCDHIKSEYLTLKNIFHVQKSDLPYLLVIICLDKRNVYAILIPIDMRPQSNTTNLWVKLYKSCTDIVDIKITTMNEVCILIGLAGGNIINIPLILKSQKPEVYHLNTTISKFTIIDNSVIYTNGLTMWKIDNIFSSSDLNIKQFVVKNVRDFCLINNQVICVTFSNLIYFFNIDNSMSYMKTIDTNYSCEVPLVTNSDYLHEIIEMVQKKDELCKKMNRESEYLLALSLSNRQDIMDNIINVTVRVYDDYRDIASKHTDLTLTDEVNGYYDSESYYFLINISIKRIQHKLNKLLSDVLGDIKVHITLFDHGILKTTSIQIKEQLTTKNFVVSLKKTSKNIKKMQVLVMIITNIPGKFDETQLLSTILYQKCIHLYAENFIDIKSINNCTHLKEDDTPLELLIYKRAKHIHGSLYKINITDNQPHKWIFFIKLPNNINLHQIKNILELIDTSNSQRAHITLKHLMKFSKNNNWLEFHIGNELVMLIKDENNLKVSCSDVIIASDMRNFFSNVIFTSYKMDPGTEFIDHRHYTTIENMKKEINSCINNRISTEDFARLFTRFLRNVYSWIPL